MTRTARVAAPLLSVLLLAACGSGPVHAGAAATVGDARIDTTTLADVVDRGLSDPQARQQLGTDRPAFQRQVLSRLITGDLLADAAATRGVTVSRGDVDARLAGLSRQLGGDEQLRTQAAQSGIAAPDLRPFVRDLALNDKLADDLVKDAIVPAATLRSLYQKNIATYDQVRARHILLKTRAEAVQVLAQVRADPTRFAALAKARSLDTGSGARGGELDPAGRGTYVKPFEAALFSATPGTFGIVQTQFGWHVYELLERRTTTLLQALPALRREALQPQREAAVGRLLRSTAERRRITVNPRFGRWDPTTGSVVEARTSGPGVVSTPGPGAGGGPVAPAGQGPAGQAPAGQAPAGPPADQAPPAPPAQ